MLLALLFIINSEGSEPPATYNGRAGQAATCAFPGTKQNW